MQPEGPICQSCGMPMSDETLFGTDADGAKSAAYCVYCYKDGAFLSDVTMEQMIELSAKGWSDQDPAITYEQAKAQMAQVLPHLARWRQDR